MRPGAKIAVQVTNRQRASSGHGASLSRVTRAASHVTRRGLREDPRMLLRSAGTFQRTRDSARGDPRAARTPLCMSHMPGGMPERLGGRVAVELGLPAADAPRGHADVAAVLTQADAAQHLDVILAEVTAGRERAARALIETDAARPLPGRPRLRVRATGCRLRGNGRAPDRRPAGRAP